MDHVQIRPIMQGEGRGDYSVVRVSESKVKLVCNECGKKRTVSPNGNFNDRCPRCGGVDWDVL